MKLLLFALALVPFSARASCGSAYCTLNTDWNLQSGARGEHAWLVDLHYDLIDQNRLWSGDHAISASRVHEDALERHTWNRNTLLTVDYGSASIGFAAIIPYVDRDHLHIADPAGAAVPERWRFSALGDVKLVGRYALAEQYGVHFGVKLPTGDIDIANASGAVAERALQPGTGSTDLVAGAWWHSGVAAATRLFAQAFWQAPVASRDDFRPGNQVTATLGARHPFTPEWVGLFQLNYAWRDHDTGAAAERDLSGLSTLQASPGLAWHLGPQAQLYGFVQWPLRREVTGVQLVADRAFAAGVSLRY